MTFAPNGTFERVNETRRIQITGIASVRGAQITMQSPNAQPETYNWSVNGGILALGGSSYIRLDSGQGGVAALVGMWLSTSDTFKTLRFGNGTFQIENPIEGNVSGTFVVTGSQLTLQAPGRQPTTYNWSIQGAFLTLSTPDGYVSEYTRAG
ncbi:MAG: hypothetical protein ACT4NY_29955 [Pseudonocardiales bacterium]